MRSNLQGVLAVLLRRARLPVLAAFFPAVGWAGLDEFHQTFVPERGGRWTDLVIDAGGAAAGLLLVEGWRRVRRGR